jgi:hypothetical protein
MIDPLRVRPPGINHHLKVAAGRIEIIDQKWMQCVVAAWQLQIRLLNLKRLTEIRSQKAVKMTTKSPSSSSSHLETVLDHHSLLMPQLLQPWEFGVHLPLCTLHLVHVVAQVFPQALATRVLLVSKLTRDLSIRNPLALSSYAHQRKPNLRPLLSCLLARSQSPPQLSHPLSRNPILRLQ